MKRFIILLVFVCFQTGALSAAQAVAYFTGFETGDGSEVVSVAAGLSIQSTTKRTGGYAAKATASRNAIILINGQSWAAGVVFRAYVRWSGTPAGNGAFMYLPIGGRDALLFVNASNQLSITNYVSTTTAGTTVLSANTWYELEFVYDCTSTLSAYVNGVLELSVSDGIGGGTVDSAAISGDDTVNVFWDDIRIDAGGVSLVGAGQTIARQGIAGTPTYNTGVKSSGTTAYNLWSETPFSATNYVTVVSAQAQTMIGDKFSTDPGRSVEGTQVVGSSDTINACKTALIAKTTVASNGKIRRRVNGTDTDTTVALTTLDKYFDDGIWTTTTANLDLLEIGTAAATANLDTIEDVWAMCDYTPAAAGTVGPRLPLLDVGSLERPANDNHRFANDNFAILTRRYIYG